MNIHSLHLSLDVGLLCGSRVNVRVGGLKFFIEELFAVDRRILVGTIHTRDCDVSIWMYKERHGMTNFHTL